MSAVCHLEATVRAQANPCEIHGGESGTGTEFSPKTLILPLKRENSVYEIVI